MTVEPIEPTEVEEFYDDFEHGNLTLNWVESGEGDWNIETPREAHSGLAAHSDNSDTESTITLGNPINLAGKTGGRLEF